MDLAAVTAMVWTAFALRYSWRAARSLGDARRDRAELKALGVNGLIRIAADGNVRRASERAYVAISALAGGIIAIFFEPGLMTRLIFTALLVGILAASSWLTDKDAADRRRMLEYAPDPPDAPKRRRIDK